MKAREQRTDSKAAKKGIFLNQYFPQTMKWPRRNKIENFWERKAKD